MFSVWRTPRPWMSPPAPTIEIDNPVDASIVVLPMPML